MEKSDIVVVVPVYKSKLSEHEKVSLKQCNKCLRDYTIVFIAPDGLFMDEYQAICDSMVYRFPTIFFNGIVGYNQLLLSHAFYERFSIYRYMLIYQLDAFVFSDRLKEFAEMGFDYIGAPWLDSMHYRTHPFRGRGLLEKIFPSVFKFIPLWVGNGGLSLRKIDATQNIIVKYEKILKNWKQYEDIFFALMGECYPNEFCVAPKNIALQFSFEKNPRECYRLNDNRLPFGCHAWQKYDIDFMRPIFEKYGYDI